MPVIAAAICPHPPLLLPSVASGAASELDNLRATCHDAVETLFAAAPDSLVVVGAGPATRWFGASDFGAFDGFGVPETYPLGGAAGSADGERLPLALAVAAWLLRAHALTRRGIAVEASAEAGACARIGSSIEIETARVGLLIMGDGSACRGTTSPGYDDPRAQPFDDSITAALMAADPAPLLGIDAALAAELRVAGRVAWQVLAGAVRASARPWRGEVLYSAAPYGVAYTVATWLPA